MLSIDRTMLYDWQLESVEEWWNNECEGIIQGVTAAGKTRIAVQLIKEYLELHIDATVTILVPSNALVDQWKSVLEEWGGTDIGRWNGVHKEMNRITVMSMASAAIYLSDIDRGEYHFMIVDECHRAGAYRWRSGVEDCVKDAILGLSATVERIDGFDVQTLCGEVIIDYMYDIALADETICDFTIKAIEINFLPEERIEYNRIVGEIEELKQKLVRKHGPRNFMGRIQNQIKSGRSCGLEIKYTAALTKRGMVINGATHRFACMDYIFGLYGNESKGMIFHHKISDLDIIGDTELMRNPERRLWQYHSAMTTKSRNDTLDEFMRSETGWLMSCKALAEGVSPDLHGQDPTIGVLLTGTLSVRQRIQTVGRLLRKGKEHATLYILYVGNSRDTDSVTNLHDRGRMPIDKFEFHFWNPSSNCIEPMPIDMAPKFGEYVGLAGPNTRGSENRYGKSSSRSFDDIFGPVPDSFDEFLKGFIKESEAK